MSSPSSPTLDPRINLTLSHHRSWKRTLDPLRTLNRDLRSTMDQQPDQNLRSRLSHLSPLHQPLTTSPQMSAKTLHHLASTWPSCCPSPLSSRLLQSLMKLHWSRAILVMPLKPSMLRLHQPPPQFLSMSPTQFTLSRRKHQSQPTLNVLLLPHPHHHVGIVLRVFRAWAKFGVERPSN